MMTLARDPEAAGPDARRARPAADLRAAREVAMVGPSPEELAPFETPAALPAITRPVRNEREILARVTAYCPCRRCCGPFANGRTSTGTNAWKRGAASDPLALPYGTEVDVPGYGTTVIDDTGIAMRRSWRGSGTVHIDVRFQYHWQARRWGTRLLRVKVRDPLPGETFPPAR